MPGAREPRPDGEPDGPRSRQAEPAADPSAAAGGAPAPAGRRRYWCRRDAGDPHRVVFEPDEAHHLERVMRHGAGAQIDAIDGTGDVLRVALEPQSSGLGGRVLAVEHDPGPRLELWLAQALIRPTRLDWLVEKAVELGVAGIQLVITARSLSADRLGTKRMARLERIGRGAVAQSLGTRAPIIRPPVALPDLDLSPFDHVRLAHGPSPECLVPLPLRHGSALVLVGPEGGFDPGEVASLEALGVEIVCLGDGRLRAETAAVAALALTRWGADHPGGRGD